MIEEIDDEFPDYFDPYGETLPDISSGRYDPDSNTFVCDNHDPIEIPQELQQTVDAMLQREQDPTPTLRQALEELIHKDDPQEADFCLPETMFEFINDNCIKFKDAVFAGPTLRSLQKCRQSELKGWIIMPASYSCRIRSRRANHKTYTPAVFVPEEALDLRAYFTN